MSNELNLFIEKLSSKEPTPGGGGASALIGAVGVALCSMVANLTSGKKKYAEYQGDIEQIIIRTKQLSAKLLTLIDKDAEVFEPLSKAYSIPKENPQRDEVLESALKTACTVPYEILFEIQNAVSIVEELNVKGSRLAISDVGVAASACRSAIEGASLNVYINTKLMKNREYAEDINKKTQEISLNAVERCNEVYNCVLSGLRG